MKKTSVYLSEEDRLRLQRLAERTGQSQAWVLREALAVYEAQRPDRNFEIFNLEPNPDAPPLPDFKDDQEFNDYMHKVVGDAIVEKYQRELRGE